MLDIVLSRIAGIIVDAGMVLGLFLAFPLVTNKNRKRKANRILSVLLVILSISILHSQFTAGQAFMPIRIREPLILAIGPLLLFYFRESAGLQTTSFRDAVHFLPLILFFVLAVPMVVADPASSFGAFSARNSVAISMTVWILALVQYGFYWWKVVHLYRKHRLAVESEFSNTEGKTLSWMRSFFHIFGVCLGLLVITVPVAIHSNDYALVATIVNCTLSITIFFLGYEGLFQEEVFSNRAAIPAVADGESFTEEAADTTKVIEEAKRLVPRLLAHMEEKRPYLNEGLTLTELAKQVGMSRNQLSLVINSGIGDSFYTFINKYRVEEAKRLIADPKKSNYTILSLAFEAGFPSKSSFHKVFKNLTGLTPTEYRDTLPRP